EKVDTLVLDKTGTLTLGKPRLISYPSDEVLRLAAAVEQSSEHPLASAIVSAAREKGIEIPKSTSFHSETGKGVSADVEGRHVEATNTGPHADPEADRL